MSYRIVIKLELRPGGSQKVADARVEEAGMLALLSAVSRERHPELEELEAALWRGYGAEWRDDAPPGVVYGSDGAA